MGHLPPPGPQVLLILPRPHFPSRRWCLLFGRRIFSKGIVLESMSVPPIDIVYNFFGPSMREFFPHVALESDTLSFFPQANPVFAPNPRLVLPKTPPCESAVPISPFCDTSPYFGDRVPEINFLPVWEDSSLPSFF